MQVILKSDESEAWGRFENTSMITPWIVQTQAPITTCN